MVFKGEFCPCAGRGGLPERPGMPLPSPRVPECAACNTCEASPTHPMRTCPPFDSTLTNSSKTV
eukprot:scaffold201309_cov37-Tisochrysis_lutea.AAC.1